jgi:hypothetical protein
VAPLPLKEPDGTELLQPVGDRLSWLDRTASALLGLAVLLALAVVFFACLTPITVTDFWWQAKTGEIIVRTGSVPTRDPFSWTANGQPWLVHEWLTEVFFYLTFVHLPNWVLLLYKCGLAALACALVLARAWLRSGSLVLGVAAALAAGFVTRNYADLRPQMITFVLLAGLLLALDEYHAGRMRRLPWALPAIFALWANLHGGVIVGLILITLWVTGEALGQWLFRQAGSRIVPLALGLAASFAAVCLNPNGFHVYAYPFQVLGHPQVMDYITEWWSPNLHNRDMLPFELLLLATLGTLALAGSFTRDVRTGEVLILTAMAHAALVSQRNTVPFALAAAPAVAGGLGMLWRGAGPLETVRAAARHPAVRTAGSAALAGMLAILLSYQIPRVPPHRWFAHAIRWDAFPHGAAEAMRRGYWPGPMYNDYVWGGFLIWKLYPQRRVFIDGRAEVYYPSRAFDDEMKIHRLEAGWEEALDRRGVEVILTDRWGNLARALQTHPRWRLEFTGVVEVVYTRVARDG